MDCKRCKKELVKDEKRGCMFCPSCHPLQKEQPKEEEKERHYVDIKMTEARVRVIVRDELENWHIQKPSVTRDEIKEVVAPPTDWRQQAKDLGIILTKPTGGARKKIDVLAEIQAKTTTSQ